MDPFLCDIDEFHDLLYYNMNKGVISHGTGWTKSKNH